MQDQTVSTVHFAEPGPQNTEATLDAALARAKQLELSRIVVASDTGKSARAVLARCGSDDEVTVVTNPRGLKLPVTKLHEYLPRFREHKEKLVSQGVKEVSCSLSDEVLSELVQSGAAVRRIDWRRFAAFTKSGLATMDFISVGVRVGLVISVWAYLSERIPEDCELLALSGTGFGGGGLDTALVVRSAAKWKGWRVCEIIARPRIGPPSELLK
jgi:hypothetical protein